MNENIRPISPIHTDLLGKPILHKDGTGTREGICRGVFIHRDTAGTPRLAMVLELGEGTLITKTCGSFSVMRPPPLEEQPRTDGALVTHRELG